MAINDKNVEIFNEQFRKLISACAYRNADKTSGFDYTLRAVDIDEDKFIFILNLIVKSSDYPEFAYQCIDEYLRINREDMIVGRIYETIHDEEDDYEESSTNSPKKYSGT